MFNLFLINPYEQRCTHDHRDDLSQRKGIPHSIQPQVSGEKVGQRQQAEKLAGDGGQKAVHAIAQCLEYGAHDDAVAGEQEAEADGSQGRDADLQHLGGGVEQQQHGTREDLEDGKAHQHDGYCDEDAESGGIHDTLLVARTVVECDDRDHAVVQSEDGHEDKTLELEVYAQYRYGGGGKAHQDQIQKIGHHGADGLHNNRRNTYFVDDADGGQAGLKAAHTDADVRILPDVENQGQHHGKDLPGDRSDGSSADAQGRKAPETKYHDRIQNDIGDGARPLGVHIVDSPSGGLEDPFKHDLQKDPKGKYQTDRQILNTIFDDDGIVGLAGKVEPRSEDPEEGKGHSAQDGKEDPVDSGPLGFLLVVLTQGAGEEGIDAHAGSAGDSDHQGLDGECHRHCGQRLLPQLGHEYTVDDIVHCLDQHGDDHRQGHSDQKPFHRHDSHFILLRLGSSFGHKRTPFR